MSVGVIGAGPVGSLLALGCTRMGLAVSLYDASPLVDNCFVNPQTRTLVLNTLTLRLLAEYGITVADIPGATPIRRIKLRQYGTPLGGVFDSRHRRGDYFGLALPQTSLQAALNQAIAKVAKHRVRISHINYATDGTIMCGDSDQSFRHQLLLIADGSDSDALRHLGIASRRASSTQQVLIGKLLFADNAATAVAGDTAYEVFDLQTNTTSVVVPQQGGATLVLLAPPDFAVPHRQWIESRLCGWLRIAEYNHQVSWKLVQSSANELIRPRVAVLGNAALTMHPLAAQGLNLAYRQCANLFASIGKTSDPGDWGGLRKFVVLAQKHQSQAHRLVQSLRLLGSDSALLPGALLAMHIPGARSMLARVGSGEML